MELLRKLRMHKRGVAANRHHVHFDNICMGLRFTLQLKKHGPLSPMSSCSGHYSDGVVCVALEASESGLSCCWVPELQGGLTTSFRTIGHSGGVEAVGSWA